MNKSSPPSAPKSNVSKTRPEAGQALRLRAEDADDLRVISACLQDAVVALSDIALLSEERRFVLVANRFRHGAGSNARQKGERILCGLSFEEVCRVQRRGIADGTVDGFLSLLSIEMAPGAETAVHLQFSGGAAIRLTVERLRARLDEMGESWPTQWAPAHDG